MATTTASQAAKETQLRQLTERVLDGRFDIDIIRRASPAVADTVERMVAEARSASPDETINALLAQAKPVVTALRYEDTGREWYDLTESRIPCTKRYPLQRLPRELVDAIIAAANGEQGFGPLADALAQAQLDFEQGNVTFTRKSKSKSKSKSK